MRPYVLALGLAAVPSLAYGHANLLDPVPRTNPAIAGKIAPCDGPRTATPSTFTPGQTITVRWEETIEHPGHYRIAFSPAGDLDFDLNVLADNIPDVTVGALPHLYQQDITLPMTECTDCTLQLIQVMTENVPPTLYYSCTDLVLAAADGDAGVGDAGDAGATPDAGIDQPDAGPGGNNDGIGDPPGLCSAAYPDGHSTSSGWSAIWLIGVAIALRLAFRRRC